MTVMKTALLMATTSFVVMLGTFAAHAEESGKADHSQMGHGSMMNHDGMYSHAMTNMHEEMQAVKPTGNADVDFVRTMIPHHQGAIDMAKVVLEKGKDPEIKKLAEGIVAAQESEIKLMNDWLAANKK